jgi:hypothetical protein
MIMIMTCDVGPIATTSQMHALRAMRTRAQLIFVDIICHAHVHLQLRMQIAISISG